MSYDDLIDETHPAGLCPICDEPIMSGEGSNVVVAHGYKFLVHSACLEDAEEEDDDLNE